MGFYIGEESRCPGLEYVKCDKPITHYVATSGTAVYFRGCEKHAKQYLANRQREEKAVRS